MSRHRIVRSMNYAEEYYDDEDEYSRSVEDNYCISPGTAAQFTWNQDKERTLDFATYMGGAPVIDEEDEEGEINTQERSISESLSGTVLDLSDTDKVLLSSCLEEIRNIIGDAVPESVITDVVIQNNFNFESSLNQLLNRQDQPKPQREKRQRRNLPQAGEVKSEGCSGTARVVTQAMPSSVVAATSSIVTPSKAKSSATVGFEVSEPTPPTSPSSSRKPAMKLKIPASPFLSSTPSKDAIESKKQIQNNTESPALSLDASLRSAVEDMGLEGDKATIQASVEAAKSSQPTPKGKSKSSKFDVMAEYAQRNGNKGLLNLVVIGHVDAGKSTLMGHLLFQLGSVNKKTMHKYEQESKKVGKSSFAYAWVLDETEEERTRGVTMDVAQTRFETDKKVIILLDAPGHKDFIPNMITGASQADVAVLVINATRGEFETGFDAGGQTREHALLARSLGVSQIIVAVNKMDTIDWNQERYEVITKKIGHFLSRQAGFKESDVSFIPCSGLSGENLVKPASEPKLISWYNTGVTLIEKIDQLEPPTRPVDKPFRMNVSDVFKAVGSGFNIAGRVGSGYVQSGDKVLILPAGVQASVKAVYIDDSSSSLAFAGDHINITMSGVDMANVNVGSCLCDPASPAKSATRIRAKVVLFNLGVPITKGFPVVFHYQSINEPAIIKRLISQLNRSTGEIIKKKPRCLVKNSSAVVEIELERSMCLELYADYKDLGRFMLRHGGHTIAAGLVEEILQSKTPANGNVPS